MKKSTVLFLAVAAVMGLVKPVKAQYPNVPKSVQAAADALIKETYRKSDSAWAVAFPIVDYDAKHGKPYVPWASRPTDLPQAPILAFPGAEGGGAYSFGGRGGKVIVVTNLNDDGPGSLRWACEQGGARIVVFNVAGIIRIKSPIIVRAPYISIEGQSAPGDGVCVAGESFWVNTHDVIIRYMRFRRGETNVGRRDDALGGNPVGNIIVDHTSTSWGLDENFSMYRHMFTPGDGSIDEKKGTANITVQNCIYAEALDYWNHAFGSTTGGENSLLIRNLWADNTGRNPSIGWNGVYNFVNNVVFNWHHRSMDGGDYTSHFNIINNYFKPGPVTPKNEPVGHRILKPESGRSKLKEKYFGRAYVNGNIVEGFPEVTKDNWAGGVQVEGEGGKELPDAGKYKDYMYADHPFPLPPAPITVLSAEQAYRYVLDNVGATLPVRDAVDKRITEQARTGKITYKEMQTDTDFQFKVRKLPKDSYKMGIITAPWQVGGYPDYKGTPYKDSDNDGIPDAWEIAHGLNPKDPTDSAKPAKNGGGYTNIEVYLNTLAEKGQQKLPPSLTKF
ncbi:polysaccharide lyase [Mucilaginibacter sp. PPCGB 2223]|uniref:polysaccharide lyase n=1 Tax=Mucilaginibacter sp. PPCGB 2223 TaxID=1886027 RepID=UPI0008254859|nr:polysaccharide lyase [Mucilaginibacter sp. PPCGB 2223]OCX53046.1 polysaccharide lyase [Mucilaginibacter sp. PPCGB 2223]